MVIIYTVRTEGYRALALFTAYIIPRLRAAAAAADIGRMSPRLHGNDETFAGDDLSLYNILSSPRNAPT